MTKKELLKMLENVNDNEKVNFIIEKTDRDGYPYDTLVKVKAVCGKYRTKNENYYGVTVKRIRGI